MKLLSSISYQDLFTILHSASSNKCELLPTAHENNHQQPPNFSHILHTYAYNHLHSANKENSQDKPADIGGNSTRLHGYRKSVIISQYYTKYR